jgi:hypothetical protein
MEDEEEGDGGRAGVSKKRKVVKKQEVQQDDESDGGGAEASKGAAKGKDTKGKKRAVQSCSECRRRYVDDHTLFCSCGRTSAKAPFLFRLRRVFRKIRCDKKFPCGPCVQRGDEAICREVGSSIPSFVMFLLARCAKEEAEKSSMSLAPVSFDRENERTQLPRGSFTSGSVDTLS